ncbi:MAG: hypothetical protein E7206_17625 [Clostridium beijerinckii]|nr:hypothetical protein [Clostridium beijerinckii]
MGLINRIINVTGEGKELNISNLLKENKILNDRIKSMSESLNDNEDLRQENDRLNDVCFNLTQDNSLMEYRIKELESDLEDYYKIQDKLLDKYEDKYNERMIVAALEKTTDDKNIYKKVINELCKRYSIDHGEVFNIIDNIKEPKCSKDIQREK